MENDSKQPGYKFTRTKWAWTLIIGLFVVCIFLFQAWQSKQQELENRILQETFERARIENLYRQEQQTQWFEQQRQAQQLQDLQNSLNNDRQQRENIMICLDEFVPDGRGGCTRLR